MEDNKFNYNYKAHNEDEKKEALSIKRQYQKEENKLTPLEELRKLDKKVKQCPMIVSLIIGIVGILIFGLGLTFVLEWEMTVLGVSLGVVSLIPIGISYPIYKVMFNKNKKKYQDRIIELSNNIIED